MHIMKKKIYQKTSLKMSITIICKSSKTSAFNVINWTLFSELCKSRYYQLNPYRLYKL